MSFYYFLTITYLMPKRKQKKVTLTLVQVVKSGANNLFNIQVVMQSSSSRVHVIIIIIN